MGADELGTRDITLEAQRFMKMFGRHLGGQYCWFPRTGPENSMMRREEILSTADLDQIDEDTWGADPAARP